MVKVITNLIKIGRFSKGVIIPKEILKKLKVRTKVLIDVKKVK